MITKEHLQKCGYFCLDEYIEWVYDHEEWSRLHDADSGLAHLIAIKRNYGDRFSAHHFPDHVVNCATLRAALFKTCHWKHQVSGHKVLMSLEQTLVGAYGRRDDFEKVGKVTIKPHPDAPPPAAPQVAGWGLF